MAKNVTCAADSFGATWHPTIVVIVTAATRVAIERNRDDAFYLQVLRWPKPFAGLPKLPRQKIC